MPPFLLALAALAAADHATIDKLTGAKGSYNPVEDVYRVTFPRNDVAVTVDGTPLHPFMGITSWAAFTSAGSGAMVMGDMVLFEDEVSSAMSAALDNGLEVTALHNHFFYDNPRVMFMHIGGHGPVDKLADAVRRVQDAVKAVRSRQAAPARAFPGGPVGTKSSITATAIDGILGVKGQTSDGMYKMSIGRKASMHGKSVSNAMGVNTWAAFHGTDAESFVDGDFAMVEAELQNVLKALRRGGIHVVAIHNHMTNEEPQYVFLHYWGKGKAADLARVLKSALDTQQK